MTPPEMVLAIFLSLQTLFHLSSALSYQQIVTKDYLSWHRLDECPSDKESYIHDNIAGHCELNEDNTFQCGGFTQYCYDNSMKISCNSYERTCNEQDNSCEEKYDQCETRVTDPKYLVLKAPGVAAKLMAECIPAVSSLRDQCNSTFSCSTSYQFDPLTDELLSCNIDCVDDFHMQCLNYTRDCTVEKSRVINTEQLQRVMIDESNCTVITRERRLDLEMEWNDTVIEVKEDGTEIVRGAVIVEVTNLYTHEQEDSWDECTEVTRVDYEPMCNQFIRNMMIPLKDVIYEPHAYNLTEGILEFLGLWESGYNIMCDYKFNCFHQLIKFSRACWPKLPLQRFVPGADYAALETLLKNMTKVACLTTPPANEKFKGDELELSRKNSCVAFFDTENGITKPLYKKFLLNCDTDTMGCSAECNETLNAFAERFGCCLGSIVYEYSVHKPWYRLFNFANNKVINKLNQCQTPIETRCEMQDPTSIVVTVVRNFLYVIGGVMTLVTISMTVSFYWQLEHEPIKKAFYHF